jgi:iron-sulfur cluster assembly accessory protein
LTESAAAKVKQLIQREQRREAALRLKVVGGGCSGLQYQLSFDEAVGEWDQQCEQHGVRVVVDAKSAVYLAGTTVDYVDDLQQSGFKIQNPTAKNTCGCGESFGV